MIDIFWPKDSRRLIYDSTFDRNGSFSSLQKANSLLSILENGSGDRRIGKPCTTQLWGNFSEIWINWMCNYPIEMTSSSSFSSAMTLSLSFVFQMLAIWITYKLLVTLIKSYFIKTAIRALSCLLILIFLFFFQLSIMHDSGLKMGKTDSVYL